MTVVVLVSIVLVPLVLWLLAVTGKPLERPPKGTWRHSIDALGDAVARARNHQ